MIFEAAELVSSLGKRSIETQEKYINNFEKKYEPKGIEKRKVIGGIIYYLRMFFTYKGGRYAVLHNRIYRKAWLYFFKYLIIGFIFMTIFDSNFTYRINQQGIEAAKAEMEKRKAKRKAKLLKQENKNQLKDENKLKDDQNNWSHYDGSQYDGSQYDGSNKTYE